MYYVVLNIPVFRETQGNNPKIIGFGGNELYEL